MSVKEFRMRIVHLILLFSITLIEASSETLCGDGWFFSHGHCYTKMYEASVSLDEAQMKCRESGGYVWVINTLEELKSLMDARKLYQGPEFVFGLKSLDNGTTWEKSDGSKETSLFELITPGSTMDENENMGCYVDADTYSVQNCVWFKRPPSATSFAPYLCEKDVILNDGPCKLKQRKHRHDATRKLSFSNTESGMCYFEIKRNLLKPAQLKIFGYNFPTGSDLCVKGFFVTTRGEIIEKVFSESLTCGRDGGTGRPLMKLRSGKGGTIRLYIALNGDGEKVWLRAKARRFMRSLPF